MKLFHHIFLFFLQIKISKTHVQFNPIKKLAKNIYSDHIHLGYDNSKKILYKEFKNNLIYGENKHKNNINCEHIWSQKYFKHKEPMKSDLHILYLSNSKLNSHRQDYKFANIHKNYIFINSEGNIIKNNFYHKIISNQLYKKNNYKKIFEPTNKSKGKISRSLAYFNLIYEPNDKNLKKLIENDNLLEWNRNHLPNIDEIKRNEIIRNYQKNINPFIKYPILIELFYNDKLNYYYIIKLSIYSLFSAALSDLIKINLLAKKNIVK